MRNKIAVSIAALSAGLALAGGASAAVNLVQNGSFETSSSGVGQLGFNTSVDQWTAFNAPFGSYIFLFGATTSDTTGANGQYGNVSLWGPGNGVANGLTASPDGGNFIASDPAFHNGALSQTVNGLVAGTNYLVTFYWAGAQQFGFDGPTTEGWQVSFGSGPSQSTAPLDLTPNHGFVPWKQTTFEFTADGISDTLSFLALGGPEATLPPFALLDGVSVVAVPEPATWGLMILGFGGIGAMVRNRRRKAVCA